MNIEIQVRSANLVLPRIASLFEQIYAEISVGDISERSSVNSPRLEDGRDLKQAIVDDTGIHIREKAGIEGTFNASSSLPLSLSLSRNSSSGIPSSTSRVMSTETQSTIPCILPLNFSLSLDTNQAHPATCPVIKLICVDPSGDPNILGWAQLPSLQQLKQGIQDFNDQLDKEIAERNQNKLETPTKGRALATGNGDASPARTRLRRKKNADSVNSPSVEDRMKAAQEKEDKEEASKAPPTEEELIAMAFDHASKIKRKDIDEPVGNDPSLPKPFQTAPLDDDFWSFGTRGCANGRVPLLGKSGQERPNWALGVDIVLGKQLVGGRVDTVGYIQCPWGCGTAIAPGALDIHLARCPSAPDPANAVSCPNASVGCTFTSSRPDMEGHVGTCVYGPLRKTIEAQKQELASLKFALEKVDSSIEDLHEEKSTLVQVRNDLLKANSLGIQVALLPSGMVVPIGTIQTLQQNGFTVEDTTSTAEAHAIASSSRVVAKSTEEVQHVYDRMFGTDRPSTTSSVPATDTVIDGTSISTVDTSSSKDGQSAAEESSEDVKSSSEALHGTSRHQSNIQSYVKPAPLASVTMIGQALAKGLKIAQEDEEKDFKTFSPFKGLKSEPKDSEGNLAVRPERVKHLVEGKAGRAFRTGPSGHLEGAGGGASGRAGHASAPDSASLSVRHWLPRVCTGSSFAHKGGTLCMCVATLSGRQPQQPGELLPTIGEESINSQAFSSLNGLHGSFLLSGGVDGTIKLWGQEEDPLTGKPVPVANTTIPVAGQAISCMGSVSNRMFCGSHDATIRMIDLSTGQEYGCMSGHSGWVHGIAVYDQVAVSASHDKTIRVWDARAKNCVHTFHTTGRGNFGIGLHSQRVVSAQGGVLFMGDLRTMTVETRKPIQERSNLDAAAAVSTATGGSSSLVASRLSAVLEAGQNQADQDEELDRRIFQKAQDQSHAANAALLLAGGSGIGPIGTYDSLSANVQGTSGHLIMGDTLYASTVDSSVSVWELNKGDIVQAASLVGHKDFVRDIISCGAHIFTVSDDGAFAAWDPAKLLGAAQLAAPAAFRSARKLLSQQSEASAPLPGSDWRPPTVHQGADPHDQNSWVSKLKSSSDGLTALEASQGKGIREATSKEQRSQTKAKGYDAMVAAKRALTGDLGGDVAPLLSLMAIKRGAGLGRSSLVSMHKEAHNAFVTNVKFMHGKLFTCSMDGSIKIWC